MCVGVPTVSVTYVSCAHSGCDLCILCPQRVTGCVSKLAESGVEAVERRLQEEQRSGQQQLAEAQCQQQHLQQELTQQQQQHEGRLAQSQQERQEEYETLQLQVLC